MASRKTWVWVFVGLTVAAVAGLVAVAAAGVYFVTRHISTEETTGAEAIRAFDTVRVTFKGERPLYELDAAEQPRVTRPLQSLPTSTDAPRHLRILAWDPDEQRLIRVALPFWMLRVGKQTLHISPQDAALDLSRLGLDIAELERIGPALVYDMRHEDGARVLLWTQ
jgi:hypothetical protein